MSAAEGMLTQLGIGASDPVDARFDFQRESLACREEFLDGNGLRGTLEHDISRVRRNMRRIGGQLVLQPNAAELALLLPWILGANASGTTYALADTQQTRVVTVDRITKVYTYTGCVVNRATFRASQGEPLQLMLDLIGIDETEGDAGTFPTLTINTAAGGPFIFPDLALSIASNTYNARDFELTIDNRLDANRFFNSLTIISAPKTDRMITTRLTLPHGDAAAVYNTGPGGVATVATFTNGTVSIAFSLAKVTYPRESPTIPGRSEIFLPLNGTAYHTGSTNSLIVTLDSTV
jgi:hypothetical protein